MRSILAAVVVFSACGGPPCKNQSDCPVGYYCVLDVSGSGPPTGECTSDCFVHSDCPQPGDNIQRAICTNEGQCRIEPLPPKLHVLEPEPDALFEDGTRRIRVTGEVETAAESVSVSAFVTANGNCAGGPPRTVVVQNEAVGDFARLPFVIDGLVVDSGPTMLNVVASVMGSKVKDVVAVEVACPGCARIDVTRPRQNLPVGGLILPRLTGRVDPASVSTAVWRIHSTFGDVFDGSLTVSDGFFDLQRLPLFAGANRVEVLVTGIGDGLGEARCSVPVASSVLRERGLRIVLSWDGPTSDLDLHLVGPGGTFGDPLSTLSPRSPNPTFGGEVTDDFDGFGPELIQLEMPEEGVYGVVVEPVYDAQDPGATAVLRVLSEGRAVTAGPIGPRHLSARAGELWVAGTISVSAGTAEWRPLDEVLEAAMPPTTDPSAWPSFFTSN